MNSEELTMMPACDVLAFGAHPDDVEIACGGAILLLQQAGMKVAVVDCTRGEMGSSGTSEQREREAAAAAAKLGLAARSNLELADTGIRDDDPSTDLAVTAIRAVRPRLLFIPHNRDAHPDHTNASNLLQRAHFLSGLKNYQPQLGEPHRAATTLRYPSNQLVEPTVVVDISSVADRKLDAVRCYQSQLAPPDTRHLVQGLDLLERTIVRQRAMGATIAAAAGEGFCHDGPLRVADTSLLFSGS